MKSTYVLAGSTAPAKCAFWQDGIINYTRSCKLRNLSRISFVPVTNHIYENLDMDTSLELSVWRFLPQSLSACPSITVWPRLFHVQGGVSHTASHSPLAGQWEETLWVPLMDQRTTVTLGVLKNEDCSFFVQKWPTLIPFPSDSLLALKWPARQLKEARAAGTCEIPSPLITRREPFGEMLLLDAKLPVDCCQWSA